MNELRYNYLEVWVPPLAAKDFRVGTTLWGSYHLTSKLPNGMKHLWKVSGHSVYGSPKGAVDDPESLIVAYNMEEHNKLFLDSRMQAIL
jgi:hypothetical protein